MERNILSWPFKHYRAYQVLSLSLAVAILGLGGHSIIDRYLHSESKTTAWYMFFWFLIWIFVGTYVVRSIWLMKKVSIVEKTLFVSDFFGEISVPTSEIAEVIEKRSRGRIFIYLNLKSDSRFGSKISFMPFDYKAGKDTSSVTYLLRDLANISTTS